METDYDVIVAGGGLTGTIVAQSISHYSNQNLRIYQLIETQKTFLAENQTLDGFVEMHVPKKPLIL